MDRRRFLGFSAGMAAAFALGSEPAETNARAERSPEMDNNKDLKKALLLSMLPAALTAEEKFQLAAAVGFEGMEVGPTIERAAIEELRKPRARRRSPFTRSYTGDGTLPCHRRTNPPPKRQ